MSDEIVEVLSSFFSKYKIAVALLRHQWDPLVTQVAYYMWISIECSATQLTHVRRYIAIAADWTLQWLQLPTTNVWYLKCGTFSISNGCLFMLNILFLYIYRLCCFSQAKYHSKRLIFEKGEIYYCLPYSHSAHRANENRTRFSFRRFLENNQYSVKWNYYQCCRIDLRARGTTGNSERDAKQEQRRPR